MGKAMFRHRQHAHILGQGRGVALFSVCAVLWLLCIVPTPAAAQPTGYQEYYVLGYEEHVWRTFRAIYDGPDSAIPGRICSTVSLVATADYQMVYYDHWEDGYEADLLDPVQPTTQIFGDRDPSNGGVGSDVLFAGDDINLTSNQNVTGPMAINGYVSVDPARNPADIRYDGRDRIITSGGPVDLTHAMWPLERSWIGGALEIYSRQAYADTYSYRLPVGEDLYDFGGGDEGIYGDFRNVYLQLGAFENNTTVLIDNGTQVVNLVLGRGQMYSSMGYIDSSPARAITINAGTIIRSNRPVQVALQTGAGGSRGYQGRSLIVLPDQMWGSDYVVPVPSGPPGDESEVYLSNPNDFPITIRAYDREVQTTFVISPTAYISATVPYSQKRGGYVPADSATRFTSPDGRFGVVVCADTSDVTYAWGFSAIPSRFLTRDYYVSWSPGSYNVPPTENGSPVWVAPVGDGTTFYVDFSPIDGTVDETFVLDVLEQRRIFDPDNDNTGMHVWASGEFAIIWGEDPRTAEPSSPYLDMGLTVLPLLQRWLDPVLTFDKVAEPTILLSQGGVVTFTLSTQAYNAPLANVDITDTLPVRWSYVPGTVHVTYPDGSTGDPEPVIGDRTLFWDLSTHLDPNQSLELSFQAQITDTDGVTVSVNHGRAVGTYEGIDVLFSPSDEAVVYISPLNLTTSVSESEVKIGDTLLYTLSYSNRSDSVVATNVVLRDPVPTQYVTFQSASDGGVLDPASGTISWEIGTLAPGVSGSVTFTVTVNESVEDGTVIKNMGYLDSAETAEAGSNQVRTTVHAPDVSFQKSGPTIAAQGAVITYTLSYANVGGAQATGVEIRDTIPVSTTYVQGSLAIDTSGGWVTLTDALDGDQGAYISPTLVIAPGVLPGSLDTGETGRIRFSVRIADDLPAGAQIWNWALLDRDLGVPRGSNLVVTRISDLSISKAADRTEVAPAGVISYTVTYENASAMTSQTAVYVRDRIPDYTSLIPGTVYGADLVEYSADNGVTWSATVPATPVTHIRWYDAELPAGVRVTAGFAVRVNGTLPPDTVIQNGAYITSTEIAEDLDWIPSNQVDVATTGTHVATISGIVFEDADGDGVRDTEEPGIPDVLVTLDGVLTATTDLLGGYTFSTTVTGVHKVVETDPIVYISTLSGRKDADSGETPGALGSPPALERLTDPIGYFSTTPNEVHVDVAFGVGYQVDFGDALNNSDFASIHGTVFNDADGSGAWDVDEAGLAGVLVTLDGAATTATDSNGSYTFPVTETGNHTVVESDPAGYFSTTSNEVQRDVILGRGYRVDFGDASVDSGFATIYGTVFEETFADGVRGSGELGISGVYVTLDGVVTTTTDSHGNYTFSTWDAGAHTVVETDPDDHWSTTPNDVQVDVTPGAGYRVDFGDVSEELPCIADIYEEDDTAAQAAVFIVGTTQAHQFCDDAVDWVRFSARANAVYTLTTFSWGQRADTYLTLFDSDGHGLLAANDDYGATMDYSSRIVWMAADDDVYFARVTNRSGLTGHATDYDLLIEGEALPTIYLPLVMRSGTIEGVVHESGAFIRPAGIFRPAGIIHHAWPDDYEIDDTWEHASSAPAIEPGVVQVHSFDSNPADYVADKDFVKFDVADAQTVIFTLAPVTNTQTLMELYDERGAALFVTGTTRLVRSFVSGGRYYLSVSPQVGVMTFGNTRTVGYNLHLETKDASIVYVPVIMREA